MQKDLTVRECEVLLLAADGKTNPETAGVLCVSIHTVETHICSIIEKLNARGRTHAVVLEIKRGIIKL